MIYTSHQFPSAESKRKFPDPCLEEVIEISSSESEQEDDPWCRNYKKYQKKFKSENFKKEEPDQDFQSKIVNVTNEDFKSIPKSPVIHHDSYSFFRCLLCLHETEDELNFENHLRLHLNNRRILAENSPSESNNTQIAENLMGELHHMKRYYSVQVPKDQKKVLFEAESSESTNKVGYEEIASTKIDGSTEKCLCFLNNALPQEFYENFPSDVDETSKVPMATESMEKARISENSIKNAPVLDEVMFSSQCDGPLREPTEDLLEEVADENVQAVDLPKNCSTLTSDVQLETLKPATTETEHIGKNYIDYQLESMFSTVATEKVQILDVETIPTKTQKSDEKAEDANVAKRVPPLRIVSNDKFKTASIKRSSFSESSIRYKWKKSKDLKKSKHSQKASEKDKKPKGLKKNKKPEETKKTSHDKSPKSSKQSKDLSKSQKSKPKQASSKKKSSKKSLSSPSNEELPSATIASSVAEVANVQPDKPIDAIPTPKTKLPLSTQKVLKSWVDGQMQPLKQPSRKEANYETTKFCDELIRAEKSCLINEGTSTSKSPTTVPESRKTTKLSPKKLVSTGELNCWMSSKVSSTRHNTKSAEMYSKMLEKKSLLDFYKCMDSDCSFTTSDVIAFFNHFSGHLKSNEKSYQSGLGHCPYCPFVVKETTIEPAKKMAHHIRDFHQNDIYQCSKCFYRSRDPDTVVEHFNMHHTSAKKLIFKCPKIKKSAEKEKMFLDYSFQRIKNKKSQIKPITCSSE